MAVVNRDAPLGRAVDRIADHDELIPVRGRGLGPEIMMQVKRVPTDLVRAEISSRRLASYTALSSTPRRVRPSSPTLTKRRSTSGGP